jgi:hypothetical protein
MNLDSKIEALKTELEQTREELNDILNDIREHLAALQSEFEDSPADDKQVNKSRTRKR